MEDSEVKNVQSMALKLAYLALKNKCLYQSPLPELLSAHHSHNSLLHYKISSFTGEHTLGSSLCFIYCVCV